MRSVEVNELRKHVLAEVYGELPFYVVSGGLLAAVVISSQEYNRLKLIEHIERMRRDNDKTIDTYLEYTAEN